MKKQLIFIISTFFLISNLSAHCDGCGTSDTHKHGSLVGNVKYEGKVPGKKTLKNENGLKFLFPFLSIVLTNAIGLGVTAFDK